MKLTDLDPRWMVDENGRRVGFIFKSPADSTWYQCCMLAPTEHKRQIELLASALPDQRARSRVQLTRRDFGWACTPDPQGAFFDSITLHPSVDGSAGGLWHGWIRNGEVTNA